MNRPRLNALQRMELRMAKWRPSKRLLRKRAMIAAIEPLPEAQNALIEHDTPQSEAQPRPTYVHRAPLKNYLTDGQEYLKRPEPPKPRPPHQQLLVDLITTGADRDTILDALAERGLSIAQGLAALAEAGIYLAMPLD